MAKSALIDELEKQFADNPRRVFARLANEYRKMGDRDRAIEICRACVPNQPTYISGYIVLGQALYESGQLDEARKTFETALGLDPENLIALRQLGDVARDMGDADTARTWYGRLLEVDPQNEEVTAQVQALAAPAPRAATPEPAAPPAEEMAAETGLVDNYSTPRGSRTPTMPINAVDDAAISDWNTVSLDAMSPTPVSQRAVGSEPPPASRDNVAEFEPLDMTDAFGAPMPSAQSSGTQSSAGDATPAAPTDLVLEGFGFDTPGAPEGTDSASTRSEPAQPDATGAQGGEPSMLDEEFAIGDLAPPAAPQPPEAATGADLGMPSIDEFAVTESSEMTPSEVSGAFAPAAHETTPDEPAADESFVEREVPVAHATDTAPPFMTETMAQLYLDQGFREEALRIYRQLADARPEDAHLRAKVDELEGRTPAAEGAEASAAPEDRATETHPERSDDVRSAEPSPALWDMEGGAADETGGAGSEPAQPALAGGGEVAGGDVSGGATGTFASESAEPTGRARRVRAFFGVVAGRRAPRRPAKDETPAQRASASLANAGPGIESAPLMQEDLDAAATAVATATPPAASPNVSSEPGATFDDLFAAAVPASGVMPPPAPPAPGPAPSEWSFDQPAFAPPEAAPLEAPTSVPSASAETAPPAGAADFAPDSLFPWEAGDVPARDESAASALASAFADDSAPAGRGSVTGDLGLDALFAETAEPPPPAARASSTFSFDQFFADEAPAAPPAPAPPPEPQTTQNQKGPDGDDLQSFNAWLDGLKK